MNGETAECQGEDNDDTPPARISLGVRTFQATPHACDVVLTLDWAIQDVVERELAAGIQRTHSVGGSAIVVEPSTGRILAMASLPAFDLNKYSESTDTLFNNPAISIDYEPGSVVKIMTMAAGLGMAFGCYWLLANPAAPPRASPPDQAGTSPPVVAPTTAELPRDRPAHVPPVGH